MTPIILRIFRVMFFFSRILDYDSDGMLFWQKQKKRHPFMLAEYPFDKRRGGVRYHFNFSKMGFTSEYAECFSFTELLNIPTMGNTGDDKERFFELLDRTILSGLRTSYWVERRSSLWSTGRLLTR